MKTSNKLIFLLIIACGLVLMGLGVSKADESDVEGLFESTCSACHDTDRPKSERKSEEDWRDTVNMMRGTYGADISDEATEKIIKYLSEHYGE